MFIRGALYSVDVQRGIDFEICQKFDFCQIFQFLVPNNLEICCPSQISGTNHRKGTKLVSEVLYIV